MTLVSFELEKENDKKLRYNLQLSSTTRLLTLTRPNIFAHYQFR